MNVIRISTTIILFALTVTLSGQKRDNDPGELTMNELVTSFDRIEAQFGFVFR